MSRYEAFVDRTRDLPDPGRAARVNAFALQDNLIPWSTLVINVALIGLAIVFGLQQESPRNGVLIATTAVLGLLIFFDDYANTLLVGNTMRPVTDRMRVSREKLSYIVDSTASPIAWLEAAQAVRQFKLGPCALNRLATWLAGMLGRYFSSHSGVTRETPWTATSSAKTPPVSSSTSG